MSSTAKIPRGEFRNPCPDVNIPAAKHAVDSLLANVTAAHKRFGDPNPIDYEIASYPLRLIQEKIVFERSLTVRRVVEARIRLTVKASLETHCLTAFTYEQALEHSDFHDEDGDDDDPQDVLTCYPLFGLVFSVKDCIHVQGLPTTLGCSQRAGQNEAATADLVQKLINAGGIMIAKTTAPQLMMSNTTHSPLWGTTRSPIQAVGAADQDGGADEFQVGGSSGGEASLVKMGGSQLGVGTDMGGSVRQPACLNEVCGFKFSSMNSTFRWELPSDFMTGLPHTSVPATAPGLLARDVSTLKLAAEALCGGKYYNCEPLTEDDFVDVYKGDPTPEPKDLGNHPRVVYTAQQSSPEVQAFVHWLVDRLASLDGEALARPSSTHELGEIDVKPWLEAWMQHATQHGFDEARAMLGDDPLIQRTLFDDSRLGVTAADRAQWAPDTSKLAELRDNFLRLAGVEQADDVIFVTPTYALGGPVQNDSFVQLDDTGTAEFWCVVFNLLDWPSVSVPISLPDRVRQTIRQAALDSPDWAPHLPGLLQADPIDADAQPRLPILSVQLATLPGNELALLDYAQRITG